MKRISIKDVEVDNFYVYYQRNDYLRYLSFVKCSHKNESGVEFLDVFEGVKFLKSTCEYLEDDIVEFDVNIKTYNEPDDDDVILIYEVNEDEFRNHFVIGNI